MVRPYYDREGVTLLHGHVLDRLADLTTGSAQCCVTSPPYWGLRDYGVDPQDWPDVEFAPMPGCAPVAVPAMRCALGLEPDPTSFVAHLVAVFREVRRVLYGDGTFWLNLGDSYAMSTRGSSGKGDKQITNKGTLMSDRRSQIPIGIKPKDLIGIPWRVAFALQADGWYLRQDIIWHKPNPMPESVRDRCTKAHEYLFLLARSERYLYDVDAVREPLRPKTFTAYGTSRRSKGNDALGSVKSDNFARSVPDRKPRLDADGRPSGANRRSVWTVATQPFPGAHFATYPSKLVDPCILAGSRPGDLVLDPFNGAGTTGLVAVQHGRRYVGIDLNADYLAMARDRIEAGRVQLSLFGGAA